MPQDDFVEARVKATVASFQAVVNEANFNDEQTLHLLCKVYKLILGTQNVDAKSMEMLESLVQQAYKAGIAVGIKAATLAIVTERIAFKAAQSTGLTDPKTQN